MKSLKTILSIFVLSIVLLSACSEKEDFTELEEFDNIQFNTETANNQENGDYANHDNKDSVE